MLGAGSTELLGGPVQVVGVFHSGHDGPLVLDVLNTHLRYRFS